MEDLYSESFFFFFVFLFLCCFFLFVFVLFLRQGNDKIKNCALNLG